jgi:hypothetical protein
MNLPLGSSVIIDWTNEANHAPGKRSAVRVAT